MGSPGPQTPQPPRQPKYQRIRAEIEARIRSGELPPGARVPTEAELCTQYGVGRATAQRTLDDLARAGLVVRYRRRGSFVAGTARRQNLLRLVDLRQHGPEMHGAHHVRDARVVPAAEAGVDLPDLAPDTPVNRLHRVKDDSSGEPLAVELSAVPFALAPHLLDEDLRHLTVLHYFHRTGVPVSTSRMYVEPTVLDPDTAETLRTEPGTPALRLRRETRLVKGGLAEAMWHIIRPGAFEFFIEQSVLDLDRDLHEHGLHDRDLHDRDLRNLDRSD